MTNSPVTCLLFDQSGTVYRHEVDRQFNGSMPGRIWLIEGGALRFASQWIAIEGDHTPPRYVEFYERPANDSWPDA